jgi:hypothetical protein
VGLGRKDGEPLRCSFCHKSQDVVGKLISSPSDYPRSYICDECIAVCNSILDDGRVASSDPAAGGGGGGHLPGREVPDKLRATYDMLERLSPDQLDAVCHLLEVLVKRTPLGTARGYAP